MEYPRALSLDQSCSLSTLTQLAQSLIPRVASTTTFMPMIPSYTPSLSYQYQVSPAQSVRNLGVVFYPNFTFSNHVSQVIKSTRVQARDLYIIRPLLDLNTSVLLANALVSSRLDYYNLLFLSLTHFELRRLQLVQNSLCRVVTHSSKFSHITPQLKKLHWLPVRYRVQFKICFITYKILTQGQPVYLRDLIHPYTSFRNTRRSTPKLKFLQTLTFDRRVHKSIKHFSNSFSHYAPALWNSFPLHVRNSLSVVSFRKHLKTHLFNSSFPT